MVEFGEQARALFFRFRFKLLKNLNFKTNLVSYNVAASVSKKFPGRKFQWTSEPVVSVEQSLFGRVLINRIFRSLQTVGIKIKWFRERQRDSSLSVEKKFHFFDRWHESLLESGPRYPMYSHGNAAKVDLINQVESEFDNCCNLQLWNEREKLDVNQFKTYVFIQRIWMEDGLRERCLVGSSLLLQWLKRFHSLIFQIF